VMEGEEIVGMISIGDLVRSIMSEQKEMINQLEQYILHYTSIT
jgi:CBS domain-containing protein